MGGSAFEGTAWLDNQPDGLVYAGRVAYCYKGTMPADTSINLSDGTKGIADGAFVNCENLTGITIPNSVTSIGRYTFSNCTNLASVTIPNSVTSIGESAFTDCDRLTEINVVTTNSAYTAQDGVLYNKNKTILHTYPAGKTGSSFTIPNSVTSIGDHAFSDCRNLTRITIPNSVTSIGRWAFYDCTNLTRITIPNSVTSIGEWAFYDCTNLTRITIPNNVTSIGKLAFSVCNSLISINVAANNRAYTSQNGVLYNKNKTTLIKYPAGKTGSSFTIPNNVTSIEMEAFRNCTGLTSITIPNSVTSIGGWAFSDCTNLTSVTIPNSVTSIGGSAFYGCRSLASVTIGSGVISGIENSGLTNVRPVINIASDNPAYSSVDGILYNKNKTSLIVYPRGKIAVSFTIPNSVTSIGSWIFEGCTSLASVTIPNSVTSIGDYAFSGCRSLTSVSFEGNIASGNFAGSAFNGLGNLRNKFYATNNADGMPGTYKRPNGSSRSWTKQ